MSTENKRRREAELYQEIYKNVTMGAESLTDLIARTEAGDLKTELGVELAQYESLAKEAKKALLDMGVTPKEEKLVARLSAKAGLRMNTMLDATPSHVAQMVIEGSTMGTTDLYRKLNEFRAETETDGEAKAVALARRAVDFEENCIEKLKSYL